MIKFQTPDSKLGTWSFFIFYFLFFSPLLWRGVGGEAFSQQQNLPLNRENNLWLERNLNNKDNFTHTGFKPYLESKVNADSLEMADSAHFKHREYQRWLARKLKSESLIKIDTGDFHLTIDPLFNFQYGKDFADTTNRKLYNNTRGFIVRADFGKKISVMSSFLENQSFFPQYIDNFVKTYAVVPGNGRVKPFKKGGYDYAMASGYVSFTPSQHFNFQIGHDKNFIGDGYRSLLLSDNAFNYPFLKITSTFWKGRIQYTNLYTQLSSLNRIPVSSTPEALFIPKLGSFHYLSIIPWKHLQIGLFEGTIWQRWDSTGTKPFNYNFINPVIFTNTAIYGLNGKNNSLLGLNLKLKILKGLAVYSQIMLDDNDNDNEKFGFQVGLKSFDLFKVKNLNFQMEFNSVAPWTYAHKIPLQNYSHYNQALAHPLGASFNELISILDYKWRDFFVQAKFNYARYDTNGENIFSSDENRNDEYILPFPVVTLYYQDYKIGYLVNRKTNMNIVAGVINREEKSIGLPHYTQFLYFGIRTSLSNQYLDF